MHCQLLRVHIIKFPMTFFQKYFFIVVSWKIYQKVAISPIPGVSGCHFGRSRAIFEKSFWLILSYLCKNWSKMLKCEILLFFVRKWLEWFKNPWYWYQEPRKLVGGWKFWKFEKMTILRGFTLVKNFGHFCQFHPSVAGVRGLGWGVNPGGSGVIPRWFNRKTILWLMD